VEHYCIHRPKHYIFIQKIHHHLNEDSTLCNRSQKSRPLYLLYPSYQGAVLSTTLFTLYIADIPHPPDTQLALYADDIAILSQSWRPETITCRLHSAMSQLFRYFTKWKLRVNVSKTELILFTKCRPPVPQPLPIPKCHHTLV